MPHGIDLIGEGAPELLVTTSEVIEEGQLKQTYFPTCGNNAAYLSLISTRIDRAIVKVKRQVGAYWATADTNIIQEVHDCILFFTVGALWQIIKNVMDAYDEESLPPEYVHPDQAAANRDYYLGEANSILARYDITPPAGAFVGAFTSGAVEETEDTILGVNY
jgi:hypothetical protein